MKKKFIYILIFILLFIPITTKAVNISSTSIVGEKEKEVGDTVSLKFNINFSELENTSATTLGIWLVAFEIDFDDSVLYPVSLTANNFESNVYLEEETGKYFVMSEVIENEISKKHCVNGTLFCDNYSIIVDFFLKNTELSRSTVKMGEVSIGLLDMNDDTKTYTYDDLIEVSSISNKTHTIMIKQTGKKVEEPKKDIVSNKNNIEQSEIKVQEELKKSSESYLSSLNIENYEIDFNKETLEYTIEIEKDINNLNITAETLDNKANYNIVGANDLKSNDYKVTVEVTAEDGSKKVYTINTKTKKEENKVDKEVNKEDPKVKKKFKITKEMIIYSSVVLGVLILIIIILLVINRRKNKEIDKYLDNL